MIRVPYEDMAFHYIVNHYDYHLEGTCWYNGKIAKFVSEDETDYQLMNDTCPHCGPEDKPMEFCHCENAPDVFCYIEELSFKDRIKYRLRPYTSLWWYLRKWGFQGFFYWDRWYYG